MCNPVSRTNINETVKGRLRLRIGPLTSQIAGIDRRARHASGFYKIRCCTILSHLHFSFFPFVCAMKYSITLLLTLIAIWFLWSGHVEPFMLILAAFSIGLSMWISLRMGIVDEEGAPVQMGLRPFIQFAPWLGKEIVDSNIEVAKIILSKEMPLKRNVVTVPAGPKSELGKVMLANSITLTPGTVSVKMEDDEILVHALSFEGAAEDLSGEMDRRIQALEK